MNNNIITPDRILEMAKNGWESIVEMHKSSNPEQRKTIL